MNQKPPPADPQPLYSRAVSSHQSGNAAEAERLYMAALAVAPDHYGANHMFGILRAQQGRMAEALDMIARGLAANPAAAEGWMDHGNVLKTLGRSADALASYDRAAALKPDYAPALSNRGDVLRQLGRHGEALDSFDQALDLNPGQVDAWNNRGIALCELGRFNEALASFNRAIGLKPDHVGAYNNRAFALRHLGRLYDALESYGRALAIQPGHVEALNNRSMILRALGRLDDALADNDRALALAPDYVESHDNRGLILLDLGRGEEALACHDRTLATAPAYAEALYHRGNALRALRRFPEAMESYDRYLAAKPARPEAWNNRGITLSDMGRPADALASYDRALAIHPDYGMAIYNRAVALWDLGRFREALAGYQAARASHPAALGGAAHAAMHMCDWDAAARIAPELLRAVARGEDSVLPFVFLGYSDDATLQRQCAKTHVQARWPSSPAKAPRYTHDKIRVGYVSSDFRRHPMANCITELLEIHDRSRFAVIAISTGVDDGSAARARIAKAADRFIDAKAMATTDIVRQIRALEIDILVDLNGHTQGARTDIFALRPAPVQLSYMGYPGTMGADFIDGVLADAIVLPEDRQPFYAEKILRLPDCYWVNDSMRAIAPTPSRPQVGLPELGFVFCCFNNNWKLTAPMFDIWMRLLAAVPGSVLWLLETNPAARENLAAAAAARGIDASRLVFAAVIDPDAHLGRHGLADLFLDTLPYNAHTSAVDALLTGVPVVTCPGQSFAARVAASLLHGVGLSELVTDDLAAYEALALALARDPARLAALKQKLEQSRAAAPLFDTGRFRRDVEALYLGLLQS